jgi:hypothetical protein
MRIGMVCEKIQREEDRHKLLGLIRELSWLIELKRSAVLPERSPPRQSNYGIEAKLYTPTEEDVEWARHLVSTIRHLGTAVFPQAGLVYMVDHHQHMLTLQNPERLDLYGSLVTHVQTVAVFDKIGYTVNEKEKEG